MQRPTVSDILPLIGPVILRLGKSDSDRSFSIWIHRNLDLKSHQSSRRRCHLITFRVFLHCSFSIFITYTRAHPSPPPHQVASFKHSWGYMVIVWRLKRLNKTSVSISTNALLWLYEPRGIVELRCLNNVLPAYGATSKNREINK